MNSIINANILYQIDNYLKVQGFPLQTRLKGFKGDVNVYRKSFPEDWFEREEGNFKKNKLKSAYDLLNTYLNQYGEKVSKEQIKENQKFDYLDINYGTYPPDPNFDYLGYRPKSFKIFNLYENEKLSDFRLLHNSFPISDSGSVGEFIDSERIDLVGFHNENEKAAIDDLEKLFYGICKEMNIEIPASIPTPKFEKITISKSKLLASIKLLQLLTRDLFEDVHYKKDGKEMSVFQNNGKDNFIANETLRNVLETYQSTYYSDWKFDPEDIEYRISQILGTEFTFSYPPETFAHNLFSYIQTELAKQNLELMNIDTFGDSYLFFIANKNEVNVILELSQVVGVKIQKL